VPNFFPEFKCNPHSQYENTVIPHYLEQHYLEQHLPKFSTNKNVIFITEKWNLVIERILNSKFVIASSMHGIIVAESFGIPGRN